MTPQWNRLRYFRPKPESLLFGCGSWDTERLGNLLWVTAQFTVPPHSSHSAPQNFQGQSKSPALPMRFLSTLRYLPSLHGVSWSTPVRTADSANKKTRCSVKFEIQINKNKSINFRIDPMQYLGPTYTKSCLSLICAYLGTLYFI